jgi:alpha/beta superfamily hydrolase
MAQRDARHRLPGPAGLIEACWEPAQSEGSRLPSPMVAVLAHPHPLYGGTMDNKVVTTLARLYRRRGVDAVRFNFRGVGASAGSHDQGRGEVEDMLAVVQWALARALFGARGWARGGLIFAGRGAPPRPPRPGAR